MSKAARARRKRAKARKARIEVRKRSRANNLTTVRVILSRAWRSVIVVWKVVGVILVLLGAVSTIYFFTWRLRVTPGTTIKDSDPFATMFILENEGEFPLYDIKFSCLTHFAETSKQQEAADILGHVDTFNVTELDGHKQTSSPCIVGIKTSDVFTYVNVSLRISYRPSFLPFRRTATYRYEARRKEDGTYAWTPKS